MAVSSILSSPTKVYAMACNKPTSQNYRQSHPSSSHIWVTRYSDASLHTTLNCTGSQERVGSAAAGAGGEVPLFPATSLLASFHFHWNLSKKGKRTKMTKSERRGVSGSTVSSVYTILLYNFTRCLKVDCTGFVGSYCPPYLETTCRLARPH